MHRDIKALRDEIAALRKDVREVRVSTAAVAPVDRDVPHPDESR
jgi:voltage-gated potassium channel